MSGNLWHNRPCCPGRGYTGDPHSSRGVQWQERRCWGWCRGWRWCRRWSHWWRRRENPEFWSSRSSEDSRTDSRNSFCHCSTLKRKLWGEKIEIQLRSETYWDNEGDVYFTWLNLLLLLAVDDVPLNVVDGEVVQTVLVVVPHHAAVVDAAVPTVGVAAVLTHAGAVMKTHRGGGK